MEKLMEALTVSEGSYLQQLLSNPIKRLIQFSDVELAEDEIAEALITAKSAKSVKIQYENNEKLRRQKANELMLPFTPDQLIAYCKRNYLERFKKEFLIDKSNEILIKKLSQYFTNYNDFEIGGNLLNKGVLIMGNVGVGKTEIMRFFQKNKKSCFRIIPSIEVADDFSVYKNEVVDVYSTPIERAVNDPDVFFQKNIGYCFDDLGTEEVKNDFGNKKNVMGDVIQTIYNKKDFSKFHITTNLSSEELESRYGTRVCSRLREMFNVFALGGSDRRI